MDIGSNTIQITLRQTTDGIRNGYVWNNYIGATADRFTVAARD